MRKILRGPTWIILVVIILAALLPATIPGFATFTSSAKAHFFFASPSIQLVCCFPTAYGNPFTLNGQGFAGLESVNISAQSTAQLFPVKLGTATAAADGTFSFTSSMPSAPYATSGFPTPINMTLIARGITSKARATLTLDERANVVPIPNAGRLGQKIQLKGGGFVIGETVTVSLQSTQVVAATADANGSFHTTFIVPASAGPGNHLCNLCATGSSGNTSVFTNFFILPGVKITPKMGPSGTAITVSGNGYFSSDPIFIYWYDPSTKTQTQLTSLNTGIGGTFQTTVTAPANLTSGNTYYVLVQALAGEPNVQVPFVAT